MSGTTKKNVVSLGLITELSKSDLFWNLMEHKLQCEVPTYLRNLLKLEGFSNVLSVKEMDDDDIEHLETFAHSEKMRKCIPKDADLADYYGNYHNDPQSFEISRGCKKMLREIIHFTHDKWCKEGPKFFDPFDDSNKAFLQYMELRNRSESFINDRKSKARKDHLQIHQRNWFSTKNVCKESSVAAPTCKSIENNIGRESNSNCLASGQTPTVEHKQPENDPANKLTGFPHQSEMCEDLILITVPSEPTSKVPPNEQESCLEIDKYKSVNLGELDLRDNLYLDDGLTYQDMEQNENGEENSDLVNTERARGRDSVNGADGNDLGNDEFFSDEADGDINLDLQLYEKGLRNDLFERVKEYLYSIDTNLLQHDEKMNSDFLVSKVVQDSKTQKFSAKIFCPVCKKPTNSLYGSARNLMDGNPGKPWWNISNYERHLAKSHSLKPKEKENRRASTRIRKQDAKEELNNTEIDSTFNFRQQEIIDCALDTKIDNQQYNELGNENHTTADTASNTADCENFSCKPPKLMKLNVMHDDEQNPKKTCQKKFDMRVDQGVSSFINNETRSPTSLEDTIQCLRNENKDLKEAVRNFELKLQYLEDVLSAPENKLLKILVDTAMNNTNKNKNAYRHGEVMKMFAAYIKIIGGALLHEFAHANLSTCVPSTSTVDRFIYDNGPKITEGVLRVDELQTYLKNRKLPFAVWIAEDATRNIGKICYDHATNELVGFVSPLNKDGLPTPHLFPARNAKEIEDHFLNNKNITGTMTYTITAQPLSEHVPPFILTLFLTDNKFTSLNVFNRWRFIRRELSKKGIDIYGYSSDGDTKCLKAMKFVTEIGTSSKDDLDCEWISFGKTFTSSPDGIKDGVYVQDPTHVITKLRGVLTKSSKILPLGDKVVSNAHLKMLIQKISKDKHLITNSDIDPKDKQNFPSAEKVCNVPGRQCLQENIPGSEATVIYLKMMDYALASYLDPTLSVCDRIKKIWYSVFLVRVWRSWLLNIIAAQKEKKKEFEKKFKDFAKKSKAKAPELQTENNQLNAESQTLPKTYTLSENFISSNAYACLEFNAHSLIKFIMKLRNNNQPELFLPLLLGSQSCESTFRQLRSLTSTFSTVVNFSLYDMLQRLRRIQLLNDITAKSSELQFPRMERKIESNKLPVVLPTDVEIFDLIEKARKEAACDARSVGINTDVVNFHCQINKITKLDDQDDNAENMDEESSDLDSDLDENFGGLEGQIVDETEKDELEKDIRVLQSISGPLIMRKYENVKLDVNSRYTAVVDPTGEKIPVRKSSIVWLLSQNKHSLSSDRLVRVQESEMVEQKRVVFQVSTNVNSEIYPKVNQEIWIGEWCLFHFNNSFLIGQVLGFSYLNGKTYRQREYSRNFANVSNPNVSESNTENSKFESKLIGVLCTYFTWDNNGILKADISHITNHQSFFDVTNYRATISNPIYVKNHLYITIELVEKIAKFIQIG